MPLTQTRILLVLGAVLALAVPMTAQAAPSRKKAIWGPATTATGRSLFPTYRDLGVGIWENRINWDLVASTRPAHPRDPADPAYQWPQGLDEAIAEGRRFGITTSLVITDAPRWASGHSNPSWAPRKPSDFADFAYAASVRYPSVRHWMIWSEPTRAENFRPLIPERRSRPLTRRMKKGPHTYARILDAAYGALKQRSRRNIVIGGNSFTTGDVSSLNWIRNLRLPNGKPPRLDLYGHNPFTKRRPVLSGPPLGYGFADFADLDLLARWVDRWLARPRGKRHIKFFLSELFWPTDHPNHEFDFWVERWKAAEWLTDALRVTRRWSRIYTLGWYSLYDDPPNAAGDEVNRGLLTYRGKKKPAYWAYKRG
jgi:hypothetical protein